MIGGEYNVRTITGDELDVIYTRSSAIVKECLARFKRMFENSNDEWVAELDVEYTIVLGSEKNLVATRPQMVQSLCSGVILDQ